MEAVVVLMGLAGLFLQSEVDALMAVEEVLWVVLPCHPNSHLGQKISRDWSCCGACRSSFSSDYSCAIEAAEELSSDRD